MEVHGERDRNFRIETESGRYLLKVHNPVEAESVLDLQDSALRHIRAVDPGLPVPDVVPTADGRPWTGVAGTDGRTSFARVMTWLDGHHPDLDRLDATRARDWGRTSARLGRALRGFVHPACSYPIAWDLRRLPQLRSWLSAVDPERRPVIEAVLDRFDDRVGPRLRTLRAQVATTTWRRPTCWSATTLRVTGVTDFGDMTHTALVCDVAVTAADLRAARVRPRPDLSAAFRRLGHLSPTRPPKARGGRPTADLIAARRASATRRRRRRRSRGRRGRRRKRATSGGVAAGGGRGRGPTSRGSPPGSLPRLGVALAGRPRLGLSGSQHHRPPCGPGTHPGALQLSYAEPIHLVAGQGVLLEAADGRRFLDAYNNVPVLGHSPPGGGRGGQRPARHPQHQQQIPPAGLGRARRAAPCHPPRNASSGSSW